MSNLRTIPMRTALFTVTYEYLLIVSPVCLYVFFSSVHADEAGQEFIRSPEWNIATIFLAFQGQSIYRALLEEKRRAVSKPVMNLVGFFVLLVIVFAASNIQFALACPSLVTTLLMWTLFIVASVYFLFFLTGAKLVLPIGGGLSGE